MLAVTTSQDLEPMTHPSGYRLPGFSKPILALVGGFGSGKTEVAVNLAQYLLSSQALPVAVVDLDLVNPYFRSRSVVTEFETLGIRAIAPRGGQFFADLPILLPEVKGAINNPHGFLILDVGGDAQGTKALGSLSVEFKPGTYEMLMVLNSRRPATIDVETSLKTMKRIEATAHLEFTGLISNSHLIHETTFDIIKEGYDLARQVESRSGLPLAFISARADLLQGIDTAVFDCPLLPLTRLMLKPWERQ